MLKTRWLKFLARSVNVPKPRQQRSRFSIPNPAMIEMLEPRALLSAVAVGSEVKLNTQTADDQSAPAVAMDSTGNYVATWQSANQDGSGWGIYAQRFNSTGVAQGAEFLVNTFTTGDQINPKIAMDSNGNFVITWASINQDGSGLGIYAQRYNSSGVAQGGEFRANTYTSSDQVTPTVAMDATGDFVIAWDSEGQYQNGYTQFIGAHSIYAQRYNAAGVAQGSEFRVTSSIKSKSTSPAVSMDTAGDFVVTWVAFDFDNHLDPFTHIQAKRYNANGTVAQDEFTAAGSLPHGQLGAAVAMAPNGAFVITWWGENGDVLEQGVRAALFDASGVAQGNSFQVNTFITGNQNTSNVAFAANGNFVITWQSNSNGQPINAPQDGGGYGIYEQQFDSLGNTIGTETRVNTTISGDQVSAAVAMNAVGDFVIAWQSSGQDGSGNGIYSQQFLSTQTPLLLQIEGQPLSAIGPLFTPVTMQLNVQDAQNSNWTGATVAITGNYQNGQDILSFTNTATITGSWNASTGTLTLTGADTVANYRAALRSVTYHNSSATPNTSATRTVSFQARAGATLSNTVARDLTVRATSTPPTVTGLDASISFVSPSPALLIAPNILITEPDGLSIQSATVSFANWLGEDRISFDNTLFFQHSFAEDLTAHTATLTITGTGSAANYQTLLRSVTYRDVAGVPNTSAVRAATFTVNDQLHNGSAAINVSVVNYLSGQSNVVSFVQGSGPLAMAPNLIVQPPVGTSIQSATVSFTNWQGEDRLSFDNTLNLQHTFTENLSARTATLTITGAASGVGYQMLLRSVTYQDLAGKPITETRNARISVNDGITTASVATFVTVTAVKPPPVVQVNDSNSLTYKVNAAAIAIMNQATITDPDSNNLTSLTIQITSGYQTGHDILSFTNQPGITGSFNSSTGTLTLSGLKYVGNYREALRLVKFNTTGSGISTATRTFSVIATDDSGTSNQPVTRILMVNP